jgi:hypothetical protein
MPYKVTQILIATNTQIKLVSQNALFLHYLKNTYFAFVIGNSLAIIPATIGGRLGKAQREPAVKGKTKKIWVR